MPISHLEYVTARVRDLAKHETRQRVRWEITAALLSRTRADALNSLTPRDAVRNPAFPVAMRELVLASSASRAALA